MTNHPNRSRTLFSMENTDGFSEAQIAILNAAVRILRSGFDCSGIDNSSISDAIGNAFGATDETPDAIAVLAAKRLGVN